MGALHSTEPRLLSQKEIKDLIVVSTPMSRASSASFWAARRAVFKALYRSFLALELWQAETAHTEKAKARRVSVLCIVTIAADNAFQNYHAVRTAAANRFYQESQESCPTLFQEGVGIEVSEISGFCFAAIR